MKPPFFTSFLKIIFAFLILFYTQNSNSQDHQPRFWSQVQYGGGLGVSFGSGFFSGTLAPSALYRFNDQFGAGVGLNMSYSTEKNYYESYILGTSILGLFNPIPQLQLSAEFEQLYVNRSDLNPFCNGFNCFPLDERYWYPGLYLGAGFHSRNVTMGIRYDVLYVENKSIYGNPYNPFVRFYF